ncbi:MAG: YbaK/EbsC family protein [Gemmataceae bacterium]
MCRPRRARPEGWARTLGVKKADLADPALAERTTGFVVGGISPLGGRSRLPTFLDDSALSFDTVLVAPAGAGCRSSCRRPTWSGSPTPRPPK